jgi:transcriptional regulator with XRE-family HTH domain
MKNLLDVLPDSPERTTGEVIKRYRLQLKITQAELSEVLEVSQSRLSEIENGTRGIGLVTARKFCAIFPISLERLVCPSGLKNDDVFIETRKRLAKSDIAV